MNNKAYLKKVLFGTTALIGSVVAPFPLPLSMAYAQTITAATTATQVLGGGGSLTITNSGSINSTNTAISVPNVAATSITNNGIVTAATNGIFITGAAADLTGGLTNNGTISLSGAGGHTGISIAAGADISGGFTNNETISVNGTTNIFIISVLTGADISGGIVNNGTLSSVLNTTNNTQAFYIYALDSPITGSFTNAGTISSQASGTGSISSIDIYFRNSDLSGSFTNTGFISSQLNGTLAASWRASQNILFNNSNLGGSFVNDGSISLTNINLGASAYGWNVRFNNSDIGGDFINNDNISMFFSATNSFSFGSDVSFSNSNITGDLINNGNFITEINSATSSGSAIGLLLSSSNVAGDLVNNGTIVSTINATTPWIGNHATFLSASDITGDLINTGILKAVANGGTGSISASGLALSVSDITGVVNNSGTISSLVTSAGATNISNCGIGVYGGSILTGGIVNSGTIVAENQNNDLDGTKAIYLRGAGTDAVGGITNTATGSIAATSTGAGTAYGVEVRAGADISGGINNAGIISGKTGIRINTATISGGVTNSGTITGTNGTAISLEALTGATLITLNGGRVVGDITDDTIANNFSSVTVAADFSTEGDITVSSMLINAGADFTMSSGDSITLDSTLVNNGTFNGAGNIIADITNNGIIAPGYSIGTQTIVGNFVQGAAGQLNIELDGTAKTTDLLDITGTATLDGTVRFTSFEGGYDVGDVFTFIQTTGGVAGAFSTVVDDLLFVNVGNVQTVGNDVQVEVLGRTSYDSIAQGYDQKAVAQTLDTLIANGQGAEIDNIFNTLSSFDQASDLLMSQSGVVNINSVNAAGIAMRQVTDIVRGRTAPTSHARSRMTSTSTYSRNSTPQSYASISPAAGSSKGYIKGKDSDHSLLADAIKIPEESTVTEQQYKHPPRPTRKNTSWIEAVGGFGELDSDSDAAGYDYETYGIAAGIEADSNDNNLKVGAFVAFSQTNSDVKGLQDESKVGSYQAGIYGAKDIGENLHLNGSASGALLLFDTDRPTVSGTADGDFTGYGAFTYGEIVYDFKINDALTLSPYGGVEASLVGHESYTETGAGNLNMEIDSNTTSQLSSEVGLQLNGNIKTQSGWNISPTIKTGWSHQYLDTSANINSRFASAPSVSFDSQGPDRARDQAKVGFNVSITDLEDDKTSFYANYDGTISSSSQDHLFTTGVKVKW